MRKTMAAVLILLFAAAGIVFAQSEAETEETIKIGLSLGTLQQERWTNERNMMQAYIDENYPNVELLVQAANSDAQRQVAQAENLIAQGADVLIVVPQDAEVSAVIVQQAHEVGVPVIAYDRMINNCDLDLYVSFDSVKVGELMAEYLVGIVPEGNYVILKGGPSDNNAHLVYEGNMNVLQQYVDNGSIKIVADQWCKDWSPAEALNHTENALTATNNNVQAIVTGWDGLAGAAIQALAAQGLAGKVAVSGQDADISACQAIVEGTQSMTVYKPLSELSKDGIDAAIALAKGEDLNITATTPNGFKDVPSILSPIYSVDKDNIDEVLIKSGFRTVEQVYANLPKSQWPDL
jgi:D-xylose transport system substrate-binding protein